jgi:hypothetical protein
VVSTLVVLGTVVTWAGSRGGVVGSGLVLVVVEVVETCSGMASWVVVVSGVGGRASCVVGVVEETCSGIPLEVVVMEEGETCSGR